MRIAITLGDPNGIGPEIAIKAANRFAHNPKIKPVLVGDGFVIEDTANRLGLDATPPFIDAAALDPAGYAPGQLDPRAGAATVGYVEAAMRLVNEGKADAIIGCPHSETAVNRAGIKFSGYPGLVADLTGTPRDRAFMMLAAKELRIVHATLHESVSAASRACRPSWSSPPLRRSSSPPSASAKTLRASACSASTRMPARTACSATTTSASPSPPSSS
jgi:4-hydroxy-L-threonine phosphate dehydrogenase PdxA